MTSYEQKIWKRVFQKVQVENIDIKCYSRRGNYVICKDNIEFELHDGEAPGYRSSILIKLTNKEIEMSDEEFHDHLYNTEKQKKEREEKEKALQEMAGRAVRRQQYEKLKLEFEETKNE